VRFNEVIFYSWRAKHLVKCCSWSSRLVVNNLIYIEVKDENLKELADIAGTKNLVNCCKFEWLRGREIRRKNAIVSASPSQKLAPGTWRRWRQSTILPWLPPTHLSHPLLCMSICYTINLLFLLWQDTRCLFWIIYFFSKAICILDASKEVVRSLKGWLWLKWGFWGVYYTRTKKWKAVKTWQDKCYNR
jgi:hypothetical protein